MGCGLSRLGVFEGGWWFHVCARGCGFLVEHHKKWSIVWRGYRDLLACFMLPNNIDSLCG